MANQTPDPPKTNDPLSAKEELLSYLLEGEDVRRHDISWIPPRETADLSPLSFAQERFWFLAQLEPNRSVYNSCKAERLIGLLDAAALEESVAAIVRRHESLRTAFPAIDGRPAQRIMPNVTVSLPVVDLQPVREAERNSCVLRLALAEASCPFDLAQGPLIRVKLLRLKLDEHVFLLSMHQIVFDSWSVGVFFSELWSLYEFYSSGKSPDLAALSIQYADFAVWQRQRLLGPTLESQLAYWKRQLGPGLPVLNLPTDRPRPLLPSYRGVRRHFALAAAMSDALKELSRQAGTTLFMTLAAAFKVLLYRYTAQEDIVVGCPVVNRSLPEIENLIGSFVNTLVLRTDVRGNPTFLEMLSSVRDVCLSAFAHQDLAFEKLVEELQPERDLSRNPLFQVMLAFQNRAVPHLALRHLRSESVDVGGVASKLDLTLSLAEQDDQIVGFFEYSVDLFDESTIERMAGHFQTLLRGIIADPGQRLSAMPMLNETERHRVLREWNDTKRAHPIEQSFHQLFEAQARKTPNATAVVFEGQRLTYEQLNARANQLAHYLQKLGVGPDVLVGICAERSLEMIVGLLGILKAGGAYVPLDPGDPGERLAFMIEDAHLPVLLTQEHLKVKLAAYEGECLCLDSGWKVIVEDDRHDLAPTVTAENMAYVIFTSGTTGKPKGAMITHRGVRNRLLWMQETYRLTTSDRVLQKTPFSFDVSVWEIFWPLLNGACLVVAPPGGHKDGAYLVNVIAEQQITVIHFVPSMLSAFLEYPDLARCRSLRLVFCSGEVLPLNLQGRFFAQIDAGLHNLYGPTEAAIDVTFWECQRGSHLLSVPIGRPIGNTQIYLLDRRLQPVPIGVSGEIYIGGDGVGHGYLNRPALTAEKFIANPFSDEPGSRLYRTGDLARYLPDGNIEFLGRIDNQVKLRGHRIELGEIEACLDQYPGLRESAVVLENGVTGRPSDADTREGKNPTEPGRSIKNPRSDSRLIAYVVPKQFPKPSDAELRAYLKEKLPEYMIPSVFIAITALPLTPSGKMDRHALPPPDGERPGLADEFTAPRTDLEELVAQVWREILQREQIGVYDNFFELGGHSLLATRVTARLRANFNIDLPVRRLFEFPTVAGLSARVEELLKSDSRTVTPPVAPVPRDRVIPASFSQQRLWFLREIDPGSTAYNISSAFFICGPLESGTLEAALNAVIARHEILRTIFHVVDGAPVQNILPSLELKLPVTDLEALPEGMREDKAREIALEEACKPFDLRSGPLLRARLLRLDQNNHYLLLSVDHTVLDGSSMAILYNEVGSLYEAFLDDRASPLPPLPVQYADYAIWQRESIQGEILDAQLTYWKEKFRDHLPAGSLPMDYPRPAVPTSRGIRKTRPLSRELSHALKELSRREGVTLFMTLLAALNVIISRHTGQDDVVVGSTIAGRNRPETEGLIGFFINALPLRTNLSDHLTFSEILKTVREVCLGAYTHQDVPFEKIVEAINPQRDLTRNPLFQVMFNMADVSERVLRLRGCEVQRASLFEPPAKFDITLYAPEKNGAIELAIVYNADLFDDARISVMLEQFAFLLAQVAEHPHQPTDHFSLVTPATRPFLPDPAEPLDDTWEGAIHERFAKQAGRVPDRVAVADPNGSWMYGELDRRSNQMAHYLIARGVKPKDAVALYAHRSSSLVLALLGIVKSGAAFMILDPAYPPARLIEYLGIVEPRGWIEMEAAGEPPQDIATYLDGLDLSCRLTLPAEKVDINNLLRSYSETAPEVAVGAVDPAYVAFTSGSTGEPKGVLSRHGPITHFLPWQKNAFDLRKTDRFSMLSGLAYSHLHRDVFTALDLGATLCIPDSQDARSPDRLAEWLLRNEITVLHLTPALGQLLLTAGNNTLPSLRRIFFGGDVLTRSEVAKIRELAPGAKIGSFYGATETQRAVGYYEVSPDLRTDGAPGRRPVPLGRGIKDVQLLLLNRNGQLAGVGELAELYVRSPHLAEGYIGEKAQSNEVFVINPFTSDPKDRLYKTGESGRYLPDGNVEWAGRNDRRVNLRGFRVELEEVEAILKRHSLVKEVAVALHDYEIPNPENPQSGFRDSTSDHRLVAYVVTEDRRQSLADLLHSYLASRLPDYMVPSHFVLVEQLPLSPNGKVDYQALPPVESFLTGQTDSLVAPRNDIEEKLCAIFAQILGREHVGVNGNFFRLGGHSLLAAQAAARVGDAFGVALELRALLESPTVEALAKSLADRIKTANTMPAMDDPDREEIEL